MKKVLTAFLIFCFLYMNYLPAIAIEKNIKKPSVGTFNKAIKSGDIEKVQKYLDTGFNPNKKHWKTWFLYGTPLIGTAISTKQNEILDILLENGALVNPNSITSPLQAAVISNNSYAVKKLLNAGANQDYTFMGLSAEHLAIKNNLGEIVKIFNEHNYSVHKPLYEALELLNNPISEIFYKNIKGENPKNKPYILHYVDFDKLIKDGNSNFSRTFITEDHIITYINSSYANCSKEALATLIAGASISHDEFFSINEAAYSTMLTAVLWSSFLQKNPLLKNNNNLLEQELTKLSDYLINEKYTLADFKILIKKYPVYKKMDLKEESPGFTNEILELPKDKSKIAKTTENVKKFWQENNMTDKLIEASVFIICTSAVIALTMWANSNTYYPPQLTPPPQQPVGTYTPTLQFVPTKTIQQINIHNGQPLNKIQLYTPVIRPTLCY